MSGRGRKRNSGLQSHQQTQARYAIGPVKRESNSGIAAVPAGENLLAQLKQNRPGLVGLLLSLLQLAGHASWLFLVTRLSNSDQAQQLDSSSPTAWLIVSLLGISLLLTAVALFVCLFMGLRRPPRTPAIIGAALAFFVGVLVSASVFLQALRSMAG